jgi:threonyl-tRNA synthetase
VRIENAGAAGLSGLLTRAILSGGLDDVERVKTFRSPEGHTFCQSASVEEGARASLVFVR